MQNVPGQLSLSGEKFLLDHFDIGCLQKTYGIFVAAIGLAIDDARDTGVDERLRAINTWQMCHVAGGAFGGDTVQCSLNDGIRLSVNRADTMSIHHEVTNFIAVFLPGRGAVEPGGQYAFLQNEHTTDEGTVAGTPF